MPKPTQSNQDSVSSTSSDLSIDELRSQNVSYQKRIDEQANEIARLQELVQTDVVTGVGNRRSFEIEIRRRHAELQRSDRPYSLLIIDLDNFKAVNDQFGHLIGDQWLQAVARFLIQQVRQSDVVTRLGGDEFAIILPGTDQGQARHVVERLVDEVVLAVGDSDMEKPVSLSIGLAEACKGMTVSQVMEMADCAMYQAKEQGGGRFQIAAQK